MKYSVMHSNRAMECRLMTTLFLLAVLVAVVVADENEYNLVRDLMRNYDSRIIPTRNSTEALNVTFRLAPSHINNLDEKNQIITTICWLIQKWIDYKLMWNPAKYGGVNVVRLPHDSIWKPDIVLHNADVSSYISTISTNVIVSSDGDVMLISKAILHSSCAINAKYFPFDEQNCSMKFASMTYDILQLNLLKVSEIGDLPNYIPSSEWTLVKLHVAHNLVYYWCCAAPFADVTYTIQIRRKPLFYIFNMILPSLLITLVALLGFCVPSDSGEKITMGITTLLSMSVFFMLVSDRMPATSNVLPAICLYYGIMTAIVSSATAMTVVTLNVHNKGQRGAEVPTVVRKVCFGVLAKILCIKIRSQGGATVEKDFHPADGMGKDTLQNNLPENGGLPSTSRFSMRLGVAGTSSGNGTAMDNFERQFLRVLHSINQTIELNEIRVAEEDRRNAIKYDWQQVALVVDRMLFFVFIAITLSVTYGILILAPPNSLQFLLG